jgi:hypothetical protein
MFTLRIPPETFDLIFLCEEAIQLAYDILRYPLVNEMMQERIPEQHFMKMQC